MKNPAVDVCIAKSPEFAQPILAHLRSLMHEAWPAIEETMKWGVPTFEYRGIVANMAAFRQHAAFGFWSQKLLQERLGKDTDGLFPKAGESSMGGRKIRALSDLPSDAVLTRAIKAAVVLNEEGIRPTRDLKKKPPVKPPPYLVAALRKNAKAKKTFEGFTASQQRHWKYQNC